jgi:hypothetical protein
MSGIRGVGVRHTMVETYGHQAMHRITAQQFEDAKKVLGPDR